MISENSALILERGIESKVFPGAVFGYVSNTGSREIVARGRHTYDSSSPRVSQDSLYDVASLTKSVVVATLADIFISSSKISLDDRVIANIPEIQNEYREKILVKHLLDYTLFYPLDSLRLSAFKDKSPEELEKYIFTRPLALEPGSSVQQTNTAPFLLGLLLERVAGKPLDALADEYIFTPARMKDSAFFPGYSQKERVVPTEIDLERGLIQGVPHDESAYVFRKTGRAVGQAGLFSSVSDLLNFIEIFLLPRSSEPLGWQYGDREFMGASDAFGRTGFTGCSLVCGLGKGIGFVLLSNRIFPKRPSDASAINAIRRELADLIWKSKL